jgi:hypothetical protein
VSVGLGSYVNQSISMYVKITPPESEKSRDSKQTKKVAPVVGKD